MRAKERRILHETVVVQREHWMCDEAGCHGEMRPTGVMQPMNPPLYPHCCTVCGAQESAHDTYPRIVYTPA